MLMTCSKTQSLVCCSRDVLTQVPATVSRCPTTTTSPPPTSLHMLTHTHTHVAHHSSAAAAAIVLHLLSANNTHTPAMDPEEEEEPMVVDDGDAAEDEEDNSSEEEQMSSEEEEEDSDDSSDSTPGGPLGSKKKKNKKKKKKKAKKPPRMYLPGMKLKDGETLTCDESAYVTLHTFTTASPCLSFDVIPDGLGDNRNSFPLTAYVVAGTQAQRSHANSIVVMKLSNVYKTQPKGSDEELSSDESENEEENLTRKADLSAALVPHHGCVNRIRFKFVNSRPLAVTWSELKKVAIFDLSVPIAALENNDLLSTYIKSKEKPKPVYSFKGHRDEGFAVDWSTPMEGTLATGDSARFIHIWRPHESSWVVDQKPLTAHTKSVEDIQWSPNEQHVLASCSVDKSLRVWDSRAKPTSSMLTRENAHSADVNVISWNSREPFIASGGDDCALRVWDLRSFTADPVAEFKNHHKAPVCSVQWNPHEPSVLASAGEDDQIAIWDLALEHDHEEASANEQPPAEDLLPPQLMFIHQGQQDIKELHWHPQIPHTIISTSATGFNIFTPANL